MDVYWLEQTEADVPDPIDWLSDTEAAVLARLRFPKRRADWILGRWTAKQAVAAFFETGTGLQDLVDIEIRAAESGAPEVLIENRPAPIVISLSHRAGLGTCAIGPYGVALGCDVEAIEHRSDAFVSSFLTPMERRLVDQAAERDLATALLWSGKESALKALEQGLRLDTRSVEVSACIDGGPEGHWHPLSAARIGGPLFSGWWRRQGSYVETLVGLPPPGKPEGLTPRITRAESSSLSVARC